MTPELQNTEPVVAISRASRDAELIARVLGGERELFHELVSPYERTVHYVTLPILRNEEEVEDATQETMLKALKNLHTFRAESKFSTWLTAIAVNEARARVRHERTLRFESIGRAVEYEGGSFTAEMITDRREIPQQALERKELRQMLEQAIANLPGMYREVLLLRDVEELSIAETAATLGISRGTVKTRLSRARRKMRKILHRSCRARQTHFRITNGFSVACRLLPNQVCKRLAQRTTAHSFRDGLHKESNSPAH